MRMTWNESSRFAVSHTPSFKHCCEVTTHASYHVGQILYLARVFRPNSPWLTIAPGESENFASRYTQKP